MEPQHALDRLPLGRIDVGQPIVDMNLRDDENRSFLFDLSGDLSDEGSTACRDATRLQRAPEGTGQSTACRSDEVVEGGGIRRKLVG